MEAWSVSGRPPPPTPFTNEGAEAEKEKYLAEVTQLEPVAPPVLGAGGGGSACCTFVGGSRGSKRGTNLLGV